MKFMKEAVMKPSALNTVGGALIATWLAVNPANALAQGEVHAATLPDDKATPTRLVPQSGNASTPEAQKPWTRKQAFRASTNQIVLHYGEGIEGIDIEIGALAKAGYPAIAVPGGSPGQVELFVARRKFGTYKQHYLDSGTLGGDGILFFDKYVKPAPDSDLISLAK